MYHGHNKTNYVSYSQYFFCTAVAARTNGCVRYSQRSVWWIAASNCYIGLEFFREELFSCLFCKGWTNFCLFFCFLRSKQFLNFFLDVRYFCCFVKINWHQHKVFQFYFYHLSINNQSKSDWFLKLEEKSQRLQLYISYDWLLIRTRHFDLGRSKLSVWTEDQKHFLSLKHPLCWSFTGHSNTHYFGHLPVTKTPLFLTLYLSLKHPLSWSFSCH